VSDTAARPDLLLRGGHLFTGDRVVADAWVAVTAGEVTAVGSGVPPADAKQVVELGTDWLAPGFVDVHVHGGGGGDFMSEDPDARRRVREFHLRHGTTSMLASTVSTSPERLHAAVARLSADVTATSVGPPAARLLGVHLEGPFLSAHRRGAHVEASLRDPDPDELARLIEAGAGSVRSLTLAPELHGAHALIPVAVAAGVVVCVGHTDADADEVRAAVDAGATAVTHTFNCMRPLHHRRPGAVGAAMDLEALTCELILDLVHVHPVAARALVHASGARRVCLVTDAMAATGMPSGRYELGGSLVDVADGQAMVAGTETLAGSTLTMAQAVANAVAVLRVDVPTAAAMASVVPAHLLRRDDLGRIAVGAVADLVRLDGEGRLRTVWRAGHEVPDVVRPTSPSIATNTAAAMQRQSRNPTSASTTVR
jgi:N-acetylglucosamine-6-phosphate deacetylase